MEFFNIIIAIWRAKQNSTELLKLHITAITNRFYHLCLCWYTADIFQSIFKLSYSLIVSLFAILYDPDWKKAAEGQSEPSLDCFFASCSSFFFLLCSTNRSTVWRRLSHIVISELLSFSVMFASILEFEPGGGRRLLWLTYPLKRLNYKNIVPYNPFKPLKYVEDR